MKYYLLFTEYKEIYCSAEDELTALEMAEFVLKMVLTCNGKIDDNVVDIKELTNQNDYNGRQALRKKSHDMRGYLDASKAKFKWDRDPRTLEFVVYQTREEKLKALNLI